MAHPEAPDSARVMVSDPTPFRGICESNESPTFSRLVGSRTPLEFYQAKFEHYLDSLNSWCAD